MAAQYNRGNLSVRPNVLKVVWITWLNYIFRLWGLLKCRHYTVQKFEIFKNCYVFERSLLCSTRLHLFEQKYSKNSNILKYYYHL